MITQIVQKTLNNDDLCECNVFEKKSQYGTDKIIKMSGQSIPCLPQCLSHLTHITRLMCIQCNIVTIPSLPPQLASLYLDGNLISDIDFKIFPKTLTDINLSNNKFKIFNASILPSSIKRLNLQNNQLTHFDMRGAKIEDLWISNNNLSQLICNKYVTVLNVDNNKNITVNFKYTTQLKRLYMVKCNISDITSLPDTIQLLDISLNCITNIDKLPSELINFNCTKNLITSLKNIPYPLKELYISGNQLEEFISINDNLTTIYCCSNKIKIMHIVSQSHKTITCYDNPLEMIINDNMKCDINYDYKRANNLLISSFGYITQLYINKIIDNETYEKLVEKYILNKHQNKNDSTIYISI